MKKSKRHPQADELLADARTVLRRLDSTWFCAFQQMLVAEIQNRRDAEKRARVEAAGKIAHEAAAKAYCEVYKRVLAEEVNR